MGSLDMALDALYPQLSYALPAGVRTRPAWIWSMIRFLERHDYELEKDTIC